MREPLVVLPDARIQDAIAQMCGCSSRAYPPGRATDSTSKRRHLVRHSCVLVVQDGHLVGIVTERDIVLLTAQQVPLEHLLVHQVMSSPVITLRESALANQALVMRQFQTHHIRHLPIVDEQDRVVGLLTQNCLQIALHEHPLIEQQLHPMPIAKDSMESKQAELEHQQLIQELSALKLGLDQSAIVAITDAQGVITYANDRFCQISGYSRQELVGRTHQLVKSNYHPPSFYQELWATICKGQVWRGEICNRAKNGSDYWVESTLVPFLDAEGRPFRYLAIRFDITARKQAEVQLQRTNEELARATRLKDEFLANMSHELRTPLNAILGMTEGLQEAIFGQITEPQRQALQTIERSGSHLLELINDILDVAKIESGQLELVYAPTAIAPLCQSSLVFIKQQALKKQIHLEVKLATHLPDLLLDELRIRQVLINLLNNAVKFTPEGGRITLDVSLQKQAVPLKPLPIQGITRVRVYRTPLEEELGLGPQLLPLSNTGMVVKDYLRIAVSDTGIGIAPEYINKLFQPFVQIDSALNRQYAGTGLGLTLVKRIVELHGGQVEFTSKVGFGSCFTIHLPYVPAVPLPIAPELQLNPHPELPPVELESSPLILLAEDNEANVEMIAGYLAAKGYRLRLAGTGEEALALTLAEAPNLILMDIQMPGMDGLEAMRQIRQRPQLAQIPVIALTALAMPGDRDRCLAAGANYYLTKPVKLKQLVSLIQQFLPVASPEPRSISP